MTQPSSPKPQFATVELQAPASRLSPLPSPRPTPNGFVVPPSPRFASGPGGKPEGEGLDEWFHDLSKFEGTLAAMAAASAEPKFNEELATIEQWFKVLSEPERTAALYTLLQHSNQSQIRFLIAVLQQMLGPAGSAPLTASLDGSIQKQQANRNLRPANLNIPVPFTPATPQFNTPLSAALPRAQMPEPQGQDLLVNRPDEGSWANMVNTPLVPMFQKTNKAINQNAMPGLLSPSMFPGGLINPMMLNSMPLTPEAQLNQLMAMQMMMGMVPPGMPLPAAMPQPQPAKQNSSKPNNWRTSGGRYAGSALRSGGSKGSGGKGGSSKGASSSATPPQDEIDPELLKDVPAWLRSLRLHKYTSCFDGMTWEEMVVLDEPTLEAKGIAALGARRRLVKTFDNVKRKMGMIPDEPEALSAPTNDEVSEPTPPTTTT
ncbi:SAM domain-containing protein [Favolaschia claudopus]|uniref:SAM domain-containing protein n=1 Tax=Favolaschia claudopus TaxID=2862362 RepID=A0AAW0E168_9AGAR